MRKIAFWPLVLLSAVASSAVCAQTKSSDGNNVSPPGAKVYFIDLKDGATVLPNFVVHFGLHGMGIAPAGVEKPNTGHHHLLIDTTLTPEQAKALFRPTIITCTLAADRPKR